MTIFFQFFTSRCYVLAPIATLLGVLFGSAETTDTTSLGVITSSRPVLVNGMVASTGTTTFSGDTIEARDGSALISFSDGNRVELVKAKATFAREGQRLIIKPNFGLMRFNFRESGDTHIIAGRYHLAAQDKGSPLIGGLAVNQNGQLSVTLCDGRFLATDAAQTSGLEVTPKKSLLLLQQTGLGSFRKGQDILTDATKSWRPDELKGKLVQVGDETHEITGNGENSLTIDGVWQKTTGWHNYEINSPPGTTALSEVAITTIAVKSLLSCMTPPSVSIVAPAAARALGAGAGAATIFQLDSKSESTRY